MEIACNIKKLRRKKRSIKFFIISLIIILICAFFGFFFRKKVNNTLFAICSSQLSLISNNVVNEAVIEAYNEFVGANFINIEKNSSGKITAISTNTHTVNDLSNKVARKCNERIDEIGKNGIKIPAGALFGIPLLQSVGPNFTLKFFSNGNCEYETKTVFEQAGINQTIHKIFYRISANVTLLYKFDNPTITVSHDILLSETIIVGEVPNYILNRI